MTNEDKELLLKDLCGRLPYGVKVNIKGDIQLLDSWADDNGNFFNFLTDGPESNFGEGFTLNVIKPYLRPMLSMTDEEFGFLQEYLPYDFTRIYSGKFDLIDNIHLGNSISVDDMAFLLDCLNKWHLDYRGLIEKGLAIEAPEDMYK